MGELSWGEWMSIGIAFTAVVLAFVSITIQKTHNKKSVVPLGEVVPTDYPDHIAVKIWNNGTGPLVCQKLRISHKNGGQKDHLIDWMPKGIMWNTFIRKPGFAIIPGHSVTLIELSTDHLETDTEFVKNRDRAREVLKELTVHLEYKDIYNKQMPEINRRLDWFDDEQKWT